MAKSTVTTGQSPALLSGRILGSEWLATPTDQKLAYCEKAFQSFRSSPSQSYIISSNVQAMTPAGFCQRLDQFYAYPINEDTPLGEAAALAPLLFSDLPL
ncbi:MAG: hypothetical protein NW237_14005 [Cyanobacteriota bacterium]|nr:hypothetical protein [Cyanobacteriota bacterium]